MTKDEEATAHAKLVTLLGPRIRNDNPNLGVEITCGECKHWPCICHLDD